MAFGHEALNQSAQCRSRTHFRRGLPLRGMDQPLLDGYPMKLNFAGDSRVSQTLTSQLKHPMAFAFTSSPAQIGGIWCRTVVPDLAKSLLTSWDGTSCSHSLTVFR